MRSDLYDEAYFEGGGGSNYVAYGDDPGWWPTVEILRGYLGDEDPYPWLEVACAKGYFVRAARTQQVECQGVDVSEYAISQAPAAVRDHVAVANALDLPFVEETFGVVCSWEFLEHVPEDDLGAVLSEMERVAAPGALLVHRIGIHIEERGSGHDEDHTHVTMRDRDWWEHLFLGRGWLPAGGLVGRLDEEFRDRDWTGRFFAYRRP